VVIGIEVRSIEGIIRGVEGINLKIN